MAFERPHDDLPSQQLLEDRAAIAHVYHHKIRDGWHERNLHFGKLFLQISAAFVDHSFRLAQVRIVAERRERARLRDAVHIEWLPCLVKDLDQIGSRDAITDPQTSESM